MSDAEAPAWIPDAPGPSRRARAWAALVEPSRAVTAPDARRRARLLATFLVILVPICLATTLLLPWMTLPGWRPWHNTSTIYSLATLAAATGLYALSRTRWHDLAAHGAVAAATICVWAVLLVAGGTPSAQAAPYFLGLGVLVASVLVPLPFTLALAAVNMAAVWLLPRTVARLSYFDVTSPFTFLAFLTACIVAVAVVRHQDLRMIDRQARRIDDSEQRYRELFETAAEGMLVVEGHRIVDANRAAQAMLSDGEDDLRGKRLDEVLPWDAPSPDNEGEEPTAYEVGVSKPGDEPRYLELIEKGNKWNGRRLRVLSLRDVTDRRRAEESRRAAYERSLEIERLQDMNQFKTRLLNTASHELNTPLTALRLQVYNLRLPKVQESPEKRREVQEVVERNIERLVELVRDITDVGRLQSDKLRLTIADMDVAATVNDIVESCRPLAAKEEIELTASAPTGTFVRADPMRVGQVLFNLISNAIKFTPAGGRVHVLADRDADGIIVRVSDTGIGMDAGSRARLFQPFTQVHDPMSVPKAGSGLGLYICRGIAELHGGELVCEASVPGQGSTFRFRLPWTPRETKKETAASATAS